MSEVTYYLKNLNTPTYRKNRVLTGKKNLKGKSKKDIKSLAIDMHNVYVDYRTHNKVYVSDGLPDNGKNFVKAFRVFSEDQQNQQLVRSAEYKTFALKSTQYKF